MNYELFEGQTQSTDFDDLPWAKDWSKSAENPSEPIQIMDVYKFDKGLMVITAYHKSFIFKKQKTASYLIEALEYFVEQAIPVQPLIVCIHNRSKVLYGVGTDYKDLIMWRFNEPNHFESIHGVDRPTANPFIPKTPTNPMLPSEAVSPGVEPRKKKSLVRPEFAQQAA
jgi:hypothetical protein